MGKTVSVQSGWATRMQDADFGDPLPVEMSTDEDGDLSGHSNKCLTVIKT